MQAHAGLGGHAHGDCYKFRSYLRLLSARRAATLIKSLRIAHGQRRDGCRRHWRRMSTAFGARIVLRPGPRGRL